MKAKADEYKLDEEQDTAVRRPLVSGGLVPGSIQDALWVLRKPVIQTVDK